MQFSLSDEDVRRIGDVLGAAPKLDGDLVRYELKSESTGRTLALELHRNLTGPSGDIPPQTLVSVYSPSAFLQLQGCTGFIASEDLGEVIFFARSTGNTNGLVVEREVGCSLYANVDEKLLSTDFTRLPPELVMSSVALSMTETLFNDLG
jgi:hypothetical protein